MKRRKVLYYALLPVQWLVDFLGWAARLLWMLIIVSNPLFLALWLMNRDKRRRRKH